MKLSLTMIAAAAGLASAKRRGGHSLKDVQEIPNNIEIKADSKTGGRLLSKARRLDGADETTWIAGYSMKFQSCVSFQDYYGGQFAANGQYNGNAQAQGGQYNGNGQYGNNYNGQYAANAYGAAEEGEEEEEAEEEVEEEEEEAEAEEVEEEEEEEDGDERRRKLQNNNNGYYYYGQDRDDYEGMYMQQLVHFKLCPSDASCWSCKNGADYVVSLNEFVDAVLEAKMTTQEYNCERVRENCYCDNANNGEEACQYNCYKNAGLEECAEAMYEQEFDVQEAVECTELEVDEEAVKSWYVNQQMSNSQQNVNNNGYYVAEGQDMGEIGQVYVGPYCTKNGKSIHLGVFMEETCSYPAPAGLYEATTYGKSLPYSKKSMVDHSCVSCKAPKEVDYDNYWEQQQEADEASEICAGLYEIAGRCEENLVGYHPNLDVTGCSYIKSLKASGMDYPRGGSAEVWAWILGGTTLALAAVAATLVKKNRRQGVSLAGSVIA